MQPRSARLALALLPLGLLAACASGRHPTEGQGSAPRTAVGSRAGSYAMAKTAPDLERLLAEDLEAGAPRRALDGLEAFVADNVRDETTARAWLVWSEVKPVTMFQFGGGRAEMTAARSLEDMLERGAQEEVRAGVESLRRGDLERVRQLRDDPMGLFNADTAAMSAEIRPYAMLADGLLRYSDLSTRDDVSESELAATLGVLNAAQSQLAQLGDGEATLLADAAAAQSLERAGQLDAAAEYWMRVAASPGFERQPELMRNLVAARVKTHSVRLKERLFLEVRDEHRAELRAMAENHDAAVERIEKEHGAFADWAREGLGATRTRLASLAKEDASLRGELEQAARASAERHAEVKVLAEELVGLDREVQALAGITDEQRADLERLAALDREQRAKIDALTALSESQREEVYRLNSTTDAQRAELESLREAAELRQRVLDVLGQRVDEADANVSRVERAVGDVGAEADARAAANEAELAQARADLAAYREAFDELSAQNSLDAMSDLLGDEAAPAAPQTVERLQIDALPDVFGALASAGDDVRAVVSALIVPGQ